MLVVEEAFASIHTAQRAMHSQPNSERRLVLNSSRIPSAMHRKPSAVSTGQEPRIIPKNFANSSTNLKIKKTIKAGTRNTAK